MILTEEQQEKIVEAVRKQYDPDFDYENPHWENGNLDDSFEYGVETGCQDFATELLKIIENQ